MGPGRHCLHSNSTKWVIIMAKILSHYEAKNVKDRRTSDLVEKTPDYVSNKELLEIVQCKLEEAKGDNASVESLISIEEQFKKALSVTRARKTKLMMELVKTLQDKEKLLKEENKVLASQIREMKKLVETEDERAMSPGNNSGNNPPATLRLLK
ncbi:PREDICTED: protein MADS AFFECTING FLOWERING 5-like isoform X1 [Camelina sativa]|uniref:Protein MADS AFFECTING FLOWERING 5-like isoform X1 n=1 Tax=Camelina sativa TaxID=90675 RepID=A0ABM1R5C5_CAMSA|nr:PREDICTED: protein MADS AFFECTING FLOWERING 5-like isoform X1 [Camelina sativa]